MSRVPRSNVFSPCEVAIAHLSNRVVRRCFLFGKDVLTGANYDHRKGWIDELIQHFAANFGIDLLAFALMSNHLHLVLRSRPDVVETWSDAEVARRWLMICRCIKKDANPDAHPTDAEISRICNSPHRVKEVRLRLSDFSWWMRLLCQRIAQRANQEDKATGKFWESRFNGVRICDEASLLACAAYVDLNPIRAAMATKLETSEYTSVKRRIEALLTKIDAAEAALDDQTGQADAFLAPLSINEHQDEPGPRPSKAGKRCSDKGFLPMSTQAYLELLDWTARTCILGKKGKTPCYLPPVLVRLKISSATWEELVTSFGKLFRQVAGHPEAISSDRVKSGKVRKLHLGRRARELFAAI